MKKENDVRELIVKANEVGDLSSVERAILVEFCERIGALEDFKRDANKKFANNDRFQREVEEEYPLLPPEQEDLSNAVRKKGVFVLGGKNSNAYKDVSLRKQVYRDIYHEIKRNYGLIDEKGREQGYKKLKRKYLAPALEIVKAYEPPIHLANQIESMNEVDEDD